MEAIIVTGGGQRQVKQGQILNVDLRPGVSAKETVVFDKVLAVLDEGKAKVGTPYVSGAQVTAEVLGVEKTPRVITHKYRRRKKSHTRRGHRQKLLRVKITAIQAG